MLIDTRWDEELSEVEKDPRMLELAMRQQRALRTFTAHQATEYIRLALEVRKELNP